MNPQAETARIRARLFATLGANLCGLNGCTVITQGGREGLRRHREAVHEGEQWAETCQTQS